MDKNDQQLAVERATRLLLGHTAGTMLVDSVPYDMLYIVDPRTGSLVLTIEDDMLSADDVVLVIPKDTFDAPIRVSLELDTEINEETCDRFLAYHLDQPMARWSRGHINFAKIESGDVINQDQLEVPNRLIGELPMLCRRLNSDPKALREVCKLLTRAQVDEPIAVGIDPLGFDVRGQFGVLRVEFPSPVEHASQAEDVIAALYGGVL
jgi:hypothetical protein